MSEEESNSEFLNTPAQRKDSQEPAVLTLYQFFIRLIASEELFARFLLFVFRLPDTHPKAEVIKAFLEGTGWFTERIWPLIFSGLLLHDGITFFTQPLDRYGNTFKDIVDGISPNQLSWSSSHLGGDRPDTVPFWLPIGAAVTLTLGLGAFRTIQRHYFPPEESRSLLVNEQDALISPKEVSWINKIQGQYALWALGKSKNIAAHLLFFPLPLYVLYAKARLLKMIILKIMLAVDYFKQQKTCSAQNKQWVYMPDFGDYKCTVCGTFPLVYYNAVFTSQGCLDGLLSAPRTPEEIFNYLEQILKHPDFTALDLSRQNWTSWPEPQWKVFLNKVSDVTDSVHIFNLSRPLLNPIFPDDGKTENLAEFLNRVNINSLDLNNQAMGDTLFTELLKSFENNTLNYLDISSNHLTAESAARLGKFIASSKTLQTLKAAHNPLSDAGIQSISRALPNSTVTIVDVSDTAIGEEGTQALAAALSDKNSPVQQLDISDNNLSTANLDALGKAAGNSSLELLDMANTHINDGQVKSFMPLAVKGSLKSLDFSNNPLTDDGMFLIINEISHSKITAVYFNQNLLTDEGLTAIAGILNSTLLETLGAANIKSFSASGIKKILENSPETLLQLDISGNDLGDDIADIMVNAFSNNTHCYLQKVYLGNNQLTDKAGEKLVRLFAVHHTKALKLDHNQLTDRTIQVLSEVFSGSQFENLDFSHNKIANDTGISDLAAKLPGSNLQILSLSANQIGDKAVVDIAKKLVTPTPHINQISKPDISVDEIRTLRQTKPQTNLTELDIRGNPTHSESKRALCRALPNTNIPFENLGLDNLEHCQTSLGNRLRPFSWRIFGQSEVNFAQNSYPVRPPVSTYPVLSGDNNCQNNTPNSNAYLYLAAACSPVMLLIVLYVLYRMVCPARDSTPGFFANTSKSTGRQQSASKDDDYSTDEDSDSENDRIFSGPLKTRFI